MPSYFQDGPTVQSSEEFLRELEGSLGGDIEPTVETPEEDPPQKRKGGIFGRTVGALARGGARALNELSNTTIGLGREIVKRTGAYKIGSEASEESFLSWYEEKVRESNPLQIPVGERDTGVIGFVESATQFGVGMLGWGKILKPLAIGGRIAKGARGASAINAAVAGAATDLTAFDPYEGRLSNMVESAPLPIRNPLTEFLAADEEDSEVTARLKAGLEGLMLGASVDGLLWGLRAMKAVRKGRTGAMSPEAAAKEAQAALDAAEASAEEAAKKDVVKLTENPDGTATLTANPLATLDGVVEEQALEMTRLSHQNNRPAAAFLDPKDGTVVPTGLSHDPDAILDPGQRERILDQAPEGGFMDPDGSWLTREEAKQRYKAKSGESSQVREAIDEAEKAGPLPLLDEPPKAEFNTVADAQQAGATLNQAAKAARRPATELTADQKESVLKIAERIASGVDPRDAENLMDGIDFNFNYVSAPEDARAIINAISETIPREAVAQTWEETIKQADGLLRGADGETVTRHIAELFGATADAPAIVTATRQYLYGLGKQIAKLSEAADLAPNNALAMDELAKALDHAAGVHEFLAPTSTNIGRTLQAHQIPVEGRIPTGKAAAKDAAAQASDAGAAKAAPDAATESVGNAKGKPTIPKKSSNRAPGPRRVTEGLSKRELRALARQVYFAEGDIEKILDAMVLSQRITGGDTTLARRAAGIRVEMMLSGPKTQIINATSNALVAVQIPTEFWWAGVRTGNKALRQQGWDMMAGNFLHVKDAMAAARQAFKTGDNALDPLVGTIDDQASVKHVGYRWLGFLRPSRYLMTTDEFFKQLSYRSRVRAMSLRAARDQGLNSAQTALRLTEDMKNAFGIDGQGVNPLALQGSRAATFTEPMEYGFGKWLQEGAERVPAVRIVAPFIRTPVNLVRHAWDRTPVLNRWSRRLQEDLAAGGERAAVAKAKTEMGMMFYGAAAALAFNGMVTGGGPKDPRLRSQWLAAGNQPYSVKIAGKQVSYRRLEPVTTPMALVADFIEMLGEVDDESSAEEMASAFGASMISSVTSKTFMQGMVEFFDAVSSGDEHKFSRAANNLILSFTPNLMRQINEDPYWRETKGLLENLQGRTPGWSSGLEPRRNLFGEPTAKPPGYFNRNMNPFTTMDTPEDSEVAQALVNLGKAMTMPPETLEGGRIDLKDRQLFDNGTGQSPYDRMMELMSTGLINKRSLRQALQREITKDTYLRSGAGTEDYPGGRRFVRVQAIVSRYHARARQKMEQEYPLLREALRAETRLKRDALLTKDTTLLNR